MEENELKPCCKQEENQNIKFLWGSGSLKSEGDYYPAYVYCLICGHIIKEIENSVY